MKFEKPGIFLSLCALTFLLSFCKKKTVDNEVQSVIDNAICEQEFMRIPQVIGAYASQTAGVQKLVAGSTLFSASCPLDTLKGDTSGYSAGAYSNTANYPVIELDYSAGCADLNDGVTRQGMIRAGFSKPYSVTGSVVTVNLIDYKAGELSYSGTLKITKGINSVNVEITDGKCSGSGWMVSWYATRTLTWLSGMGDADQSNDVYEISGTSGGVNREGRAFTTTITSGLVKASTCKWIRKGIMEVTPADLKTRIVDYGDGTCNSNASFTVNGNSYTFNMP
jgi:hypothetical protein